jgi:membrane-bound lytic murein transglycosylase D
MFYQFIKSFLRLPIKHYKVLIAVIVVTLFLLLASLFDYYISNKIFTAETKKYYKEYNIRIPKYLYFANIKVPVEKEYVRKAIAREILKNKDWNIQSKLLHERSEKWFPVIEPILKSHGIPDDFKYIALVESHLSNAVSPRGAVGFWQFLKSTGDSYGLEINDYVDERLHVIKSTQAACKYFKYSYKELGDWILVAASYNKGIGGISNQLKRQQKSNYYELKLNKETGTYVYKIIAMKELLTNNKSYGVHFSVKRLNKKIKTKKITIDSTINDLQKFSANKKIDYTNLKELNPWLLKDKLPNEGRKKYVLEIE